MNTKMFLCLIVLFFVCGFARADESTSATPAVSQQLQGFNLNGYNNAGEKAWDVNGAKADISETNIQITNVDAHFYGNQQANLTADHGTIDKANGNVALKDNVIITSKDRGTQMTTDTLNWNRSKDLVSTQDRVKIVDNQGVITGQGLTAHPNMKKVQINRHVKAVVKTSSPDEDDEADKDNALPQTITITSDGPMRMNQATMYAVFNINVIAVDASTGRELHADKMEIWFNQQTKHIKKAICTGHVKAIQGPNVSFADSMFYNGETQELTMFGRPKIVFDTSTAKGSGMFGSSEK